MKPEEILKRLIAIDSQCSGSNADEAVKIVLEEAQKYREKYDVK